MTSSKRYEIGSRAGISEKVHDLRFPWLLGCLVDSMHLLHDLSSLIGFDGYLHATVVKFIELSNKYYMPYFCCYLMCSNYEIVPVCALYSLFIAI